MIPLRDHNYHVLRPIITNIVIGLNILVFLFTLLAPYGLGDYISYSYSIVPARLDLITLVTSQFLHASFGHIIGNMLFLHIFGHSLEDYFGHIKFLLFYLFCGIVAGLGQVAVSPGSLIPILGASGAIAGLMGAYLVLFPYSLIDVFVPFGLFSQTATVSAKFMLLYWVGAQFLYGMGSIGIGGGGVAYTAHIVGFGVGWLIAKKLPLKPEIIPPSNNYWQSRF